MIWFIKHKNRKATKVRSFNISEGAEILKIGFSEEDIHTSRSGIRHLDIWGNKLKELKRLLS